MYMIVRSAVVVETLNSLHPLYSPLSPLSTPSILLTSLLLLLINNQESWTPCLVPPSSTLPPLPNWTWSVPDPSSSRPPRLHPPPRRSTTPYPVVANGRDTRSKSPLVLISSLTSPALPPQTIVTQTTPRLGTENKRHPLTPTIDQTIYTETVSPRR